MNLFVKPRWIILDCLTGNTTFVNSLPFIIGSEEFVASCYHRVKHVFYSKKEKVPNPIEGFEGIYTLKKLTE